MKDSTRIAIEAALKQSRSSAHECDQWENGYQFGIAQVTGGYSDGPEDDEDAISMIATLVRWIEERPRSNEGLPIDTEGA